MSSDQGRNSMRKQIINFRRFTAMGIIFCLCIVAACENPADGNDTKPEPEKPTENTFVKFTNREQFKVTVYMDSLRQQAVTEVAAQGSKIVAAAPSASGIAFYPTFHLDIFDVQGISVAYNAPAVVTTIAENKTTDVPIPELESIDTGSAFIQITNDSSYSLSLRQGGAEINPLGASTGVINANQSAVYEVAPGPISGYSFRRNTTDSVAFPASLTEFRPGIIYVFTYNGTSLTLTEERSVLQTIPPSAPGNVSAEMVSSDSALITWDAVYGATSYRIYRATSAEGAYSSVGTSVTASFTDIWVSVGQTYYYKITALSGAGADRESVKSTAAAVIMPSGAPGNVRITSSDTNRVILAWYVVSGSDGYNVYRSSSENGTYSRINTGAVTGNEFTDTNVSAYATYFYKVSAIINGVEGIQSNPVSASAGVIVPGSGLAAKFNWLQTNARSGFDYTVEVTADESIGPTTLSYGNRSNIGITIKGTGTERIIGLSSSGAMFTVDNGVTLVLDNNITLQGRSNNNNSLVRVNSGGTLVMNAGSTVTGNTHYPSYYADGSGGGVFVDAGTFTMTGGTVSGNTAAEAGGVCVVGTNAVFTMSGGTISGNTSSYGGGVLVDVGTFTMNGGTISGNTAAEAGGVHVVGTNAVFTMSSGTISGNTSSYGGGVLVYNSGTFTMTGGTISGNTAAEIGGGVLVDNSGTFTMNGGTVSGNTADKAGGGVFVFRGTFSKTNGTIYGYSASDTVNSNAVKNSSGTVQSDRGHAVYASSSPKHRETTAGPSVNLSWRYNNGSPVFSGDWEPDPPISNEANPIPLIENTWADGSIISDAGGTAVWYSFNVTSGTTYRVWWNDSNAGNNTKTLNVKVSAYYSNGTSIFTNIDSGWSARSFTPNTSGVVRIKVEPYSSGGIGTFAVVYSTGSTRP